MHRRMWMAVLVIPSFFAMPGLAPTVQASRTGKSGPSSVRWNYTKSLAVGSEFSAASAAPCPSHLKKTCIYVVGGNNGHVNNLRQAEAFDPATQSWKAIARMPLNDPDLAAASGPCLHSVTRTCLYAMGGGANRGVLMYDPSTNHWRSVARLHVAREDLGASAGPCRSALSRTCIYAVGGGTGASNVFIASVEMYDPVHNRWKYVASLHTGRQFAGVAEAPCWGKEKQACVYAVGGIAGKGNPVASAEMYDPSRNTWRQIAGLRTPRYSLGAAVGPCAPDINSACLFAIGGSAKPIPCGPTTCYTAVNSVERYDPANDRWTDVQPLNSPREHLAATSGPCPAAVGKHCLYALAGDADPSGGDLNTVEVYGGRGLPNIAGDWTFVTSMGTERAGLAGTSGPCARAVSHLCLFEAGGTNQTGKTLSSVEMYDPSQTAWIRVHSLPGARLWATAVSGPCKAAVSRSCVYVMGGLNGKGKVVNTVEMFDPTIGKWSAVAHLAVPLFYQGAAAAPCKPAATHTCIYAIGGSDTDSSPVSTVEMFDPTLNTWAKIASLPSARSALSVSTGPCSGNLTQTCIYALGGYGTGASPLRSVTMFEPALNLWKKVHAMSQVRYSLATTRGPCARNISTQCLYAIGGIGADDTTLTSVEMYSFKANTWSSVKPLNVPREQLSAATAPCHLQAAATCLYAVGGTTGPLEDVLPTVETFQPVNK